MNHHRQITLRELMLVVLFAGIGLSGLLVGGLMASMLVGGVMILTVGFAIVAFVGRDQLRALAIGFLIPVLAYGAMVLSIGPIELDPYEGHLPTTQLLLPAYQRIVKTEYFNLATGAPAPGYDPATAPKFGGSGFGGPAMGARETPDRKTFMSLAHILIAMLLGYCGAKFAVWLHRQQQSPATAAK